MILKQSCLAGGGMMAQLSSKKGVIYPEDRGFDSPYRQTKYPSTKFPTRRNATRRSSVAAETIKIYTPTAAEGKS